MMNLSEGKSQGEKLMGEAELSTPALSQKGSNQVSYSPRKGGAERGQWYQSNRKFYHLEMEKDVIVPPTSHGNYNIYLKWIQCKEAGQTQILILHEHSNLYLPQLPPS